MVLLHTDKLYSHDRIQLKAELNRQINSIADDEAMLAKAINYVKRLAKQKAKAEDPTRMSKEDFFQND